MNILVLWIYLSMILGFGSATSLHGESVELQLIFLEHGIKCISGVLSYSMQPSIAMCVFHGMSNQMCHAVNYNAVLKLCELIVSHESVLTFANDANFTFAAFNNTKEIIQTGTYQPCRMGNIQWKDQWKRTYVALSYPVYTDNASRDRYICKATVGDHELPGVVHVSQKTCKFVLHGKLSYAEFYMELVVVTPSNQNVVWWSHNVGDIVPRGAFVGGQTEKGIPLFVCRTLINGKYYSGYYDPSNGQASIHSGSLKHPSQIELLAFEPDGPNSAAAADKLHCPRPYVRQAYSGLEWVEHWSSDTKPPAAVISGTVPVTIAVGSIFIMTDTLAKIAYNWRFCAAYGGKVACNQWGKMLVSSVAYEWVPFASGSIVPNSAVVVAHTVENDPLYAIMKDTMNFVVGQYNTKIGQATVELGGARHPVNMHILTIPSCNSLITWTDKGFNTLSGPITAMRIQHGDTITGIQCRFGAHWSSGFWSHAHAHTGESQIDFRRNEYLRGVEIGLGDVFHFIKVLTNFEIYGPFGVYRADYNRSMITRCGQVEFFSGQICWNEAVQMNSTFALNVHGQICS